MLRFTLLASLFFANSSFGQQPKAKGIDPTKENVPYGSHARQVLDFYQAKSEKPTPLLFFIHGGGWLNGDKHSMANLKHYVCDAPKMVPLPSLTPP